jgi:hypothetical protein
MAIQKIIRIYVYIVLKNTDGSLLPPCIKNYFPKILAPKITTIRKRTRKIKNNTLAIEAAPAAISVKPKIAAMIAMIKKIAAHLSIK